MNPYCEECLNLRNLCQCQPKEEPEPVQVPEVVYAVVRNGELLSGLAPFPGAVRYVKAGAPCDAGKAGGQ